MSQTSGLMMKDWGIPGNIYAFFSPWWMAEEAGFWCQHGLVITTATKHKAFTSRKQKMAGKTSSGFLQILTPLVSAVHGIEVSLLLILSIKEMPSLAAACFLVDLSPNTLTTKSNDHNLAIKVDVFNDDLLSCCSCLGFLTADWNEMCSQHRQCYFLFHRRQLSLSSSLIVYLWKSGMSPWRLVYWHLLCVLNIPVVCWNIRSVQ